MMEVALAGIYLDGALPWAGEGGRFFLVILEGVSIQLFSREKQRADWFGPWIMFVNIWNAACIRGNPLVSMY